MLYKFITECISRRAAENFVGKLEGEHKEVEYAAADEYDFTMIVTCNEATMSSIRNRLWKLNGGNQVEVSTISEDELDAYL